MKSDTNYLELFNYYIRMGYSLKEIVDRLKIIDELMDTSDVTNLYYKAQGSKATVRQIKYQIKGRLPTLNEYIEICKRNKYIAEKLEYRARAICAAACKGVPVLDPAHKYTVNLLWHFKDFKTDPDNIYFAVKFVLDGLVISAKLPNDGCKNIGDINHSYVLSAFAGVDVELIG